MNSPLRSILDPRAALAAVVLACVTAAGPAHAQAIAVVVNGQAILSSQVASRAGLLKLTGGNPSTAKQELIDEQLKLAEAKRYGITPNKAQVDAAFASISERAKLSPEQFTKALASRGVSAQSLKDRLGAEIVWAQVIRGKFASLLARQERDVVAAMAKKSGGKLDNRATQYSLMQVIFVLPKNAPPAAVNKRLSEAKAARGRWPGCSRSVEFATSQRDVAVKDPVFRSTGQLGKDISDNLAKVKVGGLTEPQRSDEGLEMIAVCERKEIADDSVLQQTAQQDEGVKQAQEQSEKYLAQLRSKAIITGGS